MPSTFVDLHCHSTASDGTFEPRAVMELARDAGLSGIALTDHDTIGGIEEASAAAREFGIDFLPGIEISCEYPSPGTMHLLGYGIDPKSNVLRDLMQRLIEARDQRNPRIVAKLKEMGIAITMEEVLAAAAGGVVGRPHIAAILDRKGYVSSIRQAFNKYLGQGCPAYFDKERLTAKQAISLIRESGGITVLAHPIQLRTENDAQLQRVIKDLHDLGLAGIEVLHSDHDDAHVKKYAEIAEKFNLLKSGGSDFHGSNKTDIQLGFARSRRIPREWFDRIIDRIG